MLPFIAPSQNVVDASSSKQKKEVDVVKPSPRANAKEPAEKVKKPIEKVKKPIEKVEPRRSPRIKQARLDAKSMMMIICLWMLFAPLLVFSQSTEGNVTRSDSRIAFFTKYC